jgi:small-conductance mechanosensitive channel
VYTTKKEVNMKTLEKILSVLVKNLGYTVVLVLAIILFAMFSDGLISGIITAISALLAYACIMALANEFKKEPAPKSTPKKKK